MVNACPHAFTSVNMSNISPKTKEAELLQLERANCPLLVGSLASIEAFLFPPPYGLRMYLRPFRMTGPE